MKIHYFVLSVLMLCAVSCSDRAVSDRLGEVERIIQEQPDSALLLIRAVDTASLSTKSLKARYSLLMAMALDKNYIDTTDVSVIMPACEYYSKHGTPEERLKSWYYLGNFQENAGDMNSAAISFSKAEKEVEAADNLVAEGLLYMRFADVYNKVRNRDKEEEYVNKGIAAFEEAGDAKHCNLSAGRLAIVCYGKQKWSLADSLFRAGLEKAREDTVAMSVFLSNYARMKVVQPEKDPAGAIALLKEMTGVYKRKMSRLDYWAFAYASSLLGDEATCTQIVDHLMKLPDSEGQPSYAWLCLIEQNRGNYEKALDYEIKAGAKNSRQVENLLANSVTQSLQDYYEAEADRAKRDAYVTRLRFIVAILGLAVLIILYLWYSKRRREERNSEVERLLRINEETGRILSKANEDLELEKKARGDLEMTLESLRKSYASTYKEKFSSIGVLCDAYISSRGKANRSDIVYRKVQKLVSCICDDESLHREFEDQINKDLNNIVKHLKADLGDISKKESRFICYCIAGFEPEMISTVLGLSLSNVYTKKSRLKERIRGLDSPYKDEYLRML